MLGHIVELIWALLVIGLLVAYMVGQGTRGRTDANARTASGGLFDFSANQQEGKQMQALLTEVLAASQTDAEFEQSYKKASHSANGLDAELAWAWLCRTLMDYRKANEVEIGTRDLAERLLEDIPRRYQFKDE